MNCQCLPTITCNNTYSITVSSCQQCDEQQFQTLSCVHYTI